MSRLIIEKGDHIDYILDEFQKEIDRFIDVNGENASDNFSITIQKKFPARVYKKGPAPIYEFEKPIENIL